MIRETVSALAACVVTFVLCAVAYPAAVWGVGQLTFPREAEGSLIYDKDRAVIGSELIAQPFASDTYFYSRPSAVDYKADATGGSNLGTKNPDLRKKVAERALALKATEKEPVPVDLVTASGGGMDPHISPEGAAYQAARVAAARNMPVAQVRTLIARHTESSGSIIGAPQRVNVLRLNLALDEEKLAPANNDPPRPEKPAGTPEPTPADIDQAGCHSRRPRSHCQVPAAASPGLADEITSIRTRVGELAGQIERIGKQVDSATRSDTERDQFRAGVKALEERISKLAGETRQIPQVLERVDGLSGQLKAADESVRQLQAELREARDSLKTIAARPAAPVATARPRASTGLDLGPGIESFKKGDYAAAVNAFRALTREHPDDARAWYFAALANGLATGQWKGETEDLVNKGIECEKAGNPAPAEIDAAFSSLTKANGREWLTYYRQRAAR